MIGVVVPAHQEERLLPACLASLAEAARHVREPVRVLVVLDACTDGTAAVAAAAGVASLSVRARCVGVARAAGAAALLAQGARWLASTDADTVVDPRWLAHQVACGAEAVCGVVEVEDWSPHPDGVRRAFAAAYVDRDGHRHVHGANLGVSAAAYLAVGGWPPLPTGEDRALVESLLATGVGVRWSGGMRVTTSARRDPRAVGGFGDHLRGLATSA